MPPRPVVQAHEMNAFVGHLTPASTMTQISKNNNIKTHPSVRIKGTETNFNPVQCLDPACSNKNPHMHCPFCVKSESFQDPVILKAHYRVKHVDKGIEFAGLKILRCCDHCDIVGIIKGEKKFKRAHWHCYKCRNGFNRRDEAIKHYKTHFRNPQTTFQIQIAQEVTPVSHMGAEDQAATHTISQEEVSIHPVLTEAAILSSPNTEEHHTYVTRTSNNGLTNGKSNDGAVHVSVAANETVDTSDSQTIMIIKEDLSHINNSFTTQIISNEDVALLDDKITSEKQYALLQDKYEQIAMEKAQMEQDYKSEIEQLKLQIQLLNKELTDYQKREQELLSRLCPPVEKSINEMMQQMEIQYRNLLSHHLAQLRSTYLSNLPSNLTDTIVTTSSNNDSLLPSSAVSDGSEQEQSESQDYQTASSLLAQQHQQQNSEVIEVNGAENAESLQQQEHIAYLTNKVMARIQTARSHNGQVHDDIVIITSSDAPTHQNEEDCVVDSEPLIICASTVEEAALEQTVTCHSDDQTDVTTAVMEEEHHLGIKEDKDSPKDDTATQVQVLSIIHTPKEEESSGHNKLHCEPPNKRLRSES